MMKINHLFLGMLAFGLASCADLSSYRYYQTYAMIHPVESHDRQYMDSALSCRFEISEKKIEVYITNVGEKNITLEWADAKFVDAAGKRHRIANRQTIFTRDVNRTKPTTIRPGGTEENLIVPVGKMHKLEKWTWTLEPLFDQVEDRSVLNRKQVFSVILPVVIEGEERRNYRFDFMVSNVIPHRGFNLR